MEQEFQSGDVVANKLRFHYLETGSGPLVLCLHGFPDHAHTFRHQLPALAAAGYRAVAPFMRGYAPTEASPVGCYQTAMLAQDVIALIDALGAKSATVIGHDWGAVAAFGAAQLAPNKINKLITLSVPHVVPLFQAFITNPAQQRRSWYLFFFQQALADAAVAHDDFAFLDRIWQDWSPGWKYPPEEMESLKRTFSKPGVVPAALGYYRCLFNMDLHDPALAPIQAELFTKPITVPTLYFHGAKDGCIGVELVNDMDALFAGGLKKIVMPAVGHFVHQEAADAVNREILKWLV
jgi:pimeloyl-ACP methyl ester carboxylesterase